MELPAQKVVPALLATQLMAAEVYSRFLYHSTGDETYLWRKMLQDEIEHVERLKDILFAGDPLSITFPEINIIRMQEACEHIMQHGTELYLLRLEGALRLECAELDYSLEGLVSRRLGKAGVLARHQWDVRGHLAPLLEEAKRYSVSPNIGLQILRLEDLLETCLTGTAVEQKRDTTRKL